MKFGKNQLVQILVYIAGAYTGGYLAIRIKASFLLAYWAHDVFYMIILYVYLPFVFGWVVWQLLKRKRNKSYVPKIY